MAKVSGRFQNHIQIIKIAFPAILANASVPLLGLADTAAIGQTGGAVELGAIALGALVFSFVYWGFGFLRMGTTGFVAKALGAGNYRLIRIEMLRALFLGFLIGVVLIAVQHLILISALKLMGASTAIKQLVAAYFRIRIWGAPATLGTFALLGTLIGLGQTKKLLGIQLFLNGVNIALNLFFVLVLQWGVEGIALGTLIAEVCAFFLALYLVMKSLHIRTTFPFTKSSLREIANRKEVLKMLMVNTNIMIRTFALLAGFAWFTNQAAIFGDEILAANHILLQFVSFSAFFLDGYAYVIEMLTGRSIGARNKPRLIKDVRNSTQVAGITAVLLAALVLLAGNEMTAFLTTSENVRAVAARFLNYSVVYIAVSFVAFQLDGIFIGATLSKEMRNATLLSLAVFLVSDHLLRPFLNGGLWISFILYVIARGVFLILYFPRVVKEFGQR